MHERDLLAREQARRGEGEGEEETETEIGDEQRGEHARADMCAMENGRKTRGKDGGDFSTESKEEKIRADRIRRGRITSVSGDGMEREAMCGDREIS